jgi:hypothetical protein
MSDTKKPRKPKPRINTYIVGTPKLKAKIQRVVDKKSGSVGLSYKILGDPFKKLRNGNKE